MKIQNIALTGIQGAQKCVQDAVQDSPWWPFGLLLGPYLAPKSFPEGVYKDLKCVWDESWNQIAPKGRPETLQNSNLDLQTSVWDPFSMQCSIDFQSLLIIHFVIFCVFLPHPMKPAKVTLFRELLGANNL